jgi:gliding motility-associated-like protein
MALVKHLILYITISCCCLPALVSAQGENNVWAFGDSLGLDFNTADPLVISSSIKAYESCATVCDAAGNLLFYQGSDKGNTNYIWDKMHKAMPNGIGIRGNSFSSARQGTCIIPFPDRSSKYYVLTTSTMEDIIAGDTLTYLWYSVVDMSLRGGLGDVDPKYKNIVIDTLTASESIGIARGTDCALWVITNSPDTLVFNAYKISVAGIEVNPVVSGFPSSRYKIKPGSPFPGFVQASLEMSPDGQLLAFSRYDYYPLLELYDFDKATGIVSNRRVLDSVYHTLQFSPDGTKLYTSWGDLLQYDLGLLPSVPAVKASKYLVNTYARRMRDGPDRKLYALWDKSIYRINKPELAGAACDFVHYTHTGKPPANGFGLHVLTSDPPAMIYSSRDTQACFATEVLIEALPGYTSYTWADGTEGKTGKMKDPGRTWVRMARGCTVHTDTLVVSEKINGQTEHTTDTGVCFSSSITLNAPPGHIRYLWSDGSTGPSAVATAKSTVKWLRSVAKDCTVRIDTFNTRFVNFDIGLPMQVSYCPGDTIVLDASAAGATAYQWQDGSGQSLFKAGMPGNYWVQATRNNCIMSDTIRVIMSNCNNCFSIPNAFTPNGDGKNDKFRPLIQCPALRFEMKLFNRYGELMWSANDPNLSWDGTFNGQKQQPGVYFYLIKIRFDSGWVKEETYKGDFTLIR